MLKNSTKKTTLSQSFTLCNSILKKALGLMFQTKPKTLIFVYKKPTFIPLHMLFVFFPIDVIYLNKNKQVIELKKDFKPFTFYNPKNKATFVIELPKNSIKNSKTTIGDKITW